MRPKIVGILSEVVLVCLGVYGQETRSAEKSWNALADAGKAAMQKRQYAEAEEDFRGALSAAAEPGEKDARNAAVLVLLAQACDAQSKKDEAESLAASAVESIEKILKAKPKKAEEQFMRDEIACASFDQAADIFAAHQKYADAEMLYRRVIQVRAGMASEKTQYTNNEDFFRFFIQSAKDVKAKLAAANEKLGNLYFKERKYSEAAALYEEAVRVRESDQASDPRVLAQGLTNLATCYAAQGNYAQAEPLYRRALVIFEQAGWSEKPETLSTLELYALLLRKAGRDDESRAISEKAANIRKKLTGQ
jgi:tetratricopeptide (TPR) repeat protein